MRSLRIAWAALYFTGMLMIIVDLSLRSIYSVNGVPVISAPRSGIRTFVNHIDAELAFQRSVG